MKITIDTKEDSKEEIKKAIRMLSAIVGDSDFYTNTEFRKEHHANIFESGSSSIPQSSSEQPSQPVSVFGSIFGEVSLPQAAPASQSQEIQDEKPAKKPEIQIIEY